MTSTRRAQFISSLIAHRWHKTKCEESMKIHFFFFLSRLLIRRSRIKNSSLVSCFPYGTDVNIRALTILVDASVPRWAIISYDRVVRRSKRWECNYVVVGFDRLLVRSVFSRINISRDGVVICVSVSAIMRNHTLNANTDDDGDDDSDENKNEFQRSCFHFVSISSKRHDQYSSFVGRSVFRRLNFQLWLVRAHDIETTFVASISISIRFSCICFASARTNEKCFRSNIS